MPLLRREVVLDGVRLRYLKREANGDERKAALLFLHGLIASAACFTALIAQIPESYRVIALDIPGTDVAGTAVAGASGLQRLAELVQRFVETAGLRKPVILGHSHGGLVALQMAVLFPERVTGLILMSPAHPFLLRERPLIAFYNSRLGNAFVRSFRHMPLRLQEIGFTRVMGAKGRAAKIDIRPYRDCLKDYATMTAVLRLIKSWNEDMDALRARLEAEPIRLPALFLWGDRDPVVPIATAPRLQKHLTRWEQFTLVGVGHLPNDEAPEECGALIRTWLIWLETGRLVAGR